MVSNTLSNLSTNNMAFKAKKGVFLIKQIVYFDYGGSHSSVTAACIHAGKLDPNKIPNKDELMEMPYLDKTNSEDFGKIKHIGTDKDGNEIYSLGTKVSQLGSMLDDMALLQGVSDQYLFLCTSPYVNNVLRVGGWLSRSASLPALGRPLVVSGLRKAYPALCSFVETTHLRQGGMQQ